eukprot:NODE_4643_length_759_cov_29.034810_g4484_i0.p1 GENE.NODE_4643_length_759_cov_29.034810_g4484_i0~~NODE_4643_length_759_cov_29.034810_g4484_i0.p1  ORF type:complete len:230 (+),score=31.07 NODE_4643_length_759_cov_29.034810_g4484_i0:35-691(+)
MNSNYHSPQTPATRMRLPFVFAILGAVVLLALLGLVSGTPDDLKHRNGGKRRNRRGLTSGGTEDIDIHRSFWERGPRLMGRSVVRRRGSGMGRRDSSMGSRNNDCRCLMSSWSEDSACSCDTRIQLRKRSILKRCRDCKSPLIQARVCDPKNCPANQLSSDCACSIEEWTEWGRPVCQDVNGDGKLVGMKNRTRPVSNCKSCVGVSNFEARICRHKKC